MSKTLDDLTERIRKINEKEKKMKSVMSLVLFLLFSGITGIGVWIVVLLIKALLKYIGS